MNTVHVDLSLEQLKQALRQLPPQEKIAVWRMLDGDLDREAIAQRFTSTVNAVRKAYAHTKAAALIVIQLALSLGCFSGTA